MARLHHRVRPALFVGSALAIFVCVVVGYSRRGTPIAPDAIGWLIVPGAGFLLLGLISVGESKRAAAGAAAFGLAVVGVGLEQRAPDDGWLMLALPLCAGMLAFSAWMMVAAGARRADGKRPWPVALGTAVFAVACAAIALTGA